MNDMGNGSGEGIDKQIKEALAKLAHLVSNAKRQKEYKFKGDAIVNNSRFKLVFGFQRDEVESNNEVIR